MPYDALASLGLCRSKFGYFASHCLREEHAHQGRNSPTQRARTPVKCFARDATWWSQNNANSKAESCSFTISKHKFGVEMFKNKSSLCDVLIEANEELDEVKGQEDYELTSADQNETSSYQNLHIRISSIRRSLDWTCSMNYQDRYLSICGKRTPAPTSQTSHTQNSSDIGRHLVVESVELYRDAPCLMLFGCPHLYDPPAARSKPAIRMRCGEFACEKPVSLDTPFTPDWSAWAHFRVGAQ